MVLLLLALACAEPAPPTTTPDAGGPPPVPGRAVPPGPGGAASPPGLPGGPQGPPLGPDGRPLGPAGPGASGAMMQDPSGFPPFHDQPAPPGPGVEARGAWSAPVKLTVEPGGGYRPQIAVGADGALHAVYYERAEAGDLLRHRRLPPGQPEWTPAVALGFDRDRNWGPDIVARPDGSVVVAFDHMLPDMQSRGWLTVYRDGAWSAPEPLTPDEAGEVGSGHVAHGPGDELVYVYIGKPLDPAARFQARWRWLRDGTWSAVQALTDGVQDAWHTNVERRPDGSVLAGWDVGQGGAATTLYVAEGRDGRFSAPEDLTASGRPGERPHFAFGLDGVDHVAWFHKEAGRPIAVYVRSGRPGAWGAVEQPSQGLGGFHFDPDIAINAAGVRCLVWGWDAGAQAELVYSLDRGEGWSAPARVADIGWGKPGLPSVDVDAEGAFHVVWNQGVRGDNDVYYAALRP